MGVDIETDYAEMQALMGGKWTTLLPRLFRRAMDSGRVRRAQGAYRGLVADGTPTAMPWRATIP